MIFNCSKCKKLSPDYVNSASGLDLHRFNWLEDEGLIGELDKSWNYLVDEINPENFINGTKLPVKLAHWTGALGLKIKELWVVA